MVYPIGEQLQITVETASVSCAVKRKTPDTMGRLQRGKGAASFPKKHENDLNCLRLSF